MAVTDKWHKTYPKDDEQRCGVHRGKVATTLHGKGKRWQVRYRDADGEQKAQSFERYAEAQGFDSKVQQDLTAGTYVDMTLGKTTLAEYARNRWLPAQLHLRPNSAELYRQHLEAQILPRLGKRPLVSLRKTDIVSFVAVLVSEPSGSTKKPLMATTIGTVMSVLKAVLESAVSDRMMASNPARRVPLPRVEHPDVIPLARDSVLRLAAEISPGYRATVMIAALGGLRQGEVLGLREGDVDFLRRRIHVRQQAQNGSLSPLKTRASARVVPADAMLLEEISEHMRKYPRGPHGTIIVNAIGRIPSRSAFGTVWRAAVKNAGLPRGTRFHELRHFYASVLIAANLNPKVVQARMGHSTISETMDTYSHLFPEAEEFGRGTFDALFGDANVHRKCTGDASG